MENWMVTSMTLTLATPTIVTLAVFIVYSVLSGLDPTSVFPALILLGMLRTLLFNLPQHQAKFMSARISMKRLVEYFFLPEVSDSNKDDNSLSLGTIKIESGSFAWKQEVNL